jgi:hypothetical protein
MSGFTQSEHAPLIAAGVAHWAGQPGARDRHAWRAPLRATQGRRGARLSPPAGGSAPTVSKLTVGTVA